MKNVFGVVALLSSAGVMASDDNGKALDLSAELGVLSISGNSESSSVKTKLNIKHDLTNWRNSYLLEGLYKEDTVSIIDTNGDAVKENKLTAKKYFASAQTDYKLNEKHRGLFLYGSYLYDRFSGYEYQATIAAGYSDQLFKTDSSFLNYSIGPGVAFFKVEDTLDEDGNVITGEKDNSPIVRLSASYQYDIRKGAKFTQDLSSDIAIDSEENTKTKSVTAVSAQLNDSFSMKLSYTITHNSEVPLNIDKTDTETAVTVVYSF